MANYKMIDYDHQQDGFLCNGNLSDMEGRFEAHWTFGDHDNVLTEEHPLTREGFALLWSGIAVSVSGNGVFANRLVADPTRLVDIGLHHVITTTQVEDGRLRHRTFMVPVDETDLAFVAWMGALAAPGSMRRDSQLSARREQAADVTEHAKAAVQCDEVPA